MNAISNQINRYIIIFADLFLLNLLWLILCIPVITIFPSTVAMYSVVRKWVMKKDTDGVIRPFFLQFHECFVQSLGISILWAILGYFIYLDFQIFHANKFLLLALFLISLLFFSLTIYLFPIMAHFQTNWKNIIRNSLIIAVFSPLSTITLLTLLITTLFLIFLFPILLLILGSFFAYFSYRICHRLFMKLSIYEN